MHTALASALISDSFRTLSDYFRTRTGPPGNHFDCQFEQKTNKHNTGVPDSHDFLFGYFGLRSARVVEFLRRNANSAIKNNDFGLLSDYFKLLSDSFSDSPGSRFDWQFLHETTEDIKFPAETNEKQIGLLSNHFLGILRPNAETAVHPVWPLKF